MSPIAWPDSSLQFFCDDPNADVNARGFCCLDWMRDYCASDDVLASYFSRAADMVVEQLLSRPQSNSSDGLFMPVTYLYRHSIELQLKELVRFFISSGELVESDLKKDLLRRGHALVGLWNPIEPLLRKLGNDENDPVTNVSSFLKDLDSCDPDGSHLRYSRKKPTDPPYLNKFPARVDLVKLRESVRAVGNFLSGCLDCASQLRDC